MHKLRKSVVDNIYAKCTGAEICFLLHVAQFQTKKGIVRHVRCKDICYAISISKQTFYNILASLSVKRIINVKKESHGDYSIEIINNSFTTSEDYSRDKGYITTQYDFLHELPFRELKVNTKRLALKMMRVLYRLDTDKPFKVSYDTMLDWLGIKHKRVLKQYLKTLEQYFVIYYKQDSCAFKLRKVEPVSHYRLKNTETYKYLRYRFTHICRKYKIAYTSTDLHDFLLLFRQYPDKHKQLYFAFIKSVKIVNLVQPALIHSLFLKAA